MSDAAVSGAGASPKRVAKKVHYPFGTPAHVNHPYSQFAHLSSSVNMSFALSLATATDIQPEVIEEDPYKNRRRSVSKKKKSKSRKTRKVGNDGGDGEEVDEAEEEEEEEEEEIENFDEEEILSLSSGMKPCTKIPCQQIMRSIADIQHKNEVERMDIKDEFDRIGDELRDTEAEIVQSEGRLDKLTDIGNQLEISYNQVTVKVEALEKLKETLQNERTDINTKLMLLEVERQKANRRLEKAQKELTNARWKKKKAAQSQQQQDALDGGLSLPPSLIADRPIVQRSAAEIAEATDISDTQRNVLANAQVIDLLERPATVKTVPVYLQDKYFAEENTIAKDARLDSYARRHVETRMLNSLHSWEEQTLSGVVSAMDPFSKLSVQQSSRRSESHSSPSPGVQILSLSPTRSIASLRTASHTTHSIHTASQQGHHNSGIGIKTKSAGGRQGRSSQELANDRQVAMLQSMQSLLTYSQDPRLEQKSISLSKSLSHSVSLKESIAKSISQSSTLSQSVALSTGGSSPRSLRLRRGRLRPLSPMSIDRADGANSMSSLQLGGSLDRDDATVLECFAEKLLDGGVVIDKAFPKLAKSLAAGGNAKATESLEFTVPTPKKKLDKVFYKTNQQEQWGRNSLIGSIRTREPTERELQERARIVSAAMNETGKPGDDKTSGRTVSRTGQPMLDIRTLPKVQSRTLTIKHPGMPCFDDSDLLR